MKRRQGGLTLTGLLLGSIVLVVVAIVVMKVLPTVTEYYAINKAVNAIAASADAQAGPVEVRRAFERHAQVDDIHSIAPGDLQVAREGGQTVISFAYEKRIPLVANVSLLIEYQGAARGR